MLRQIHNDRVQHQGRVSKPLAPLLMNVFFFGICADPVPRIYASGGEESESGERLEAIGLLLLSRMNKFDGRRNAPIVDRYEQHFSPVRLAPTAESVHVCGAEERCSILFNHVSPTPCHAMPCHAASSAPCTAVQYDTLLLQFFLFPSSSSEFLDEILHCLNGEGCCTRNESGCVFWIDR